jgi:uncharacterized membrane-anchored protein
VIDLRKTRRVLTVCNALVNELDGQELDDREAVTSQSRGEARRRNAQLSQDLQQLAAKLELAAALVRNEYWYARGEEDPLEDGRDD